MNMLVTGGAGFIGRHLTEASINKGYSVNVLDNLSSGHKQNLSGILDNCISKILKYAALTKDCMQSIIAHRLEHREK